MLDIFESTETKVHQLDGLVHISLVHEVSEVELGHGLGDSDDSQQGSWSDVGVALLFVPFTLELSLLNVSGHYVVVKVGWNDWVEGLSVSNVGLHDLLVHHGCTSSRSTKLFVHIGYMCSQPLIVSHVSSVEQQEDDIESGKQGSWKVHVLVGLQLGVVSSVDGVCSSQDGGSCVE